ncbi:growth/differentiation factor 8-like [Ylistrum balloti]|uniref:growth/differentiation factor 8-like n=1 Tax=Ylistrum balloti TaxID=509963 RepID=UPI002905C02E|nr:growth/differentiation factor 8-like [Ylistrum balloti]
MEQAAVFVTFLYFSTFVGFILSAPERSSEKQQFEIRFIGSKANSQTDSNRHHGTHKVALINTGAEDETRRKTFVDDEGNLNQKSTYDSTNTAVINKTEVYTQSKTLDDINDTKLNSTERTFSENEARAALKNGHKPRIRTLRDENVLAEADLKTGTDSNPEKSVDVMKLREQEHIEQIKRRVLEKLRMDSPPQLHGPRPALPFKYLQHEYMNDGSDARKRRRAHPNFYARKKQVLVTGSDVTVECTNKKGAGCYHFDVDGKVNPNDIFSAEIWIYKLFHHHDPHIQTFIVSELKQDNQGRRRPKNMVNRVETSVKYGWLKIKVKRSVIRWLQKPRQNHGIAIVCRSCIRKNPRTIFSFKSDTRPFLVITTKKGHNVRHTRSTPRICTERSTECCMKPLTINFNDIGWDSVISPVSFQANYCYGSCEGQHQAHYNHTQMIQDHRWNQEEWNTMRQLRPCCAPISYSSMSIMYIVNNDLQVDFVPNLVATACGCV